MIRSRWCLSLLLALLAVVGASPATAQCILDDNLGGPCCELADLQLPQFPQIQLQTKYICWQDCDVRLSGEVRASLRLRPVACGYYLLRYSVTNATGNITIWSGTLVATYVRTFAESRMFGQLPPDYQVWRFLINGDLTIDPGIVQQFGNNTCVVPASYQEYGRLHVSGYADWALDCATGEWSVAYALGHECDPFEHQGQFTCRPGVFNPNRSYTWVGPAAGFVCSPDVVPPTGELLCEAFRNYDFTQPLGRICQTEQRVAQGQIETLGEFCPCEAAPGGLPQYKVQALQAVSACNSAANTTPFEAWPGLLSKSIGFWSDPAVYPGQERLFLERGFFDYVDGCSGDGDLEYFLGVQTAGGFDVWKIIFGDLADASEFLIDLGNAQRGPQPGPPATPPSP